MSVSFPFNFCPFRIKASLFADIGQVLTVNAYIIITRAKALILLEQADAGHKVDL